MYLKSIEVQGFKSFANRIKLDFDDGITGIVGPNGSGKSNVADAVRWVLGEQRVRQLRGGNMQDVIFAGTENRRPLSFASVSITLDNTDHALPIDYSEVTVTRKLYRSGESEYLINGSTCRLKDINELFYDTGIGKEGYSIIGQGQIERILSDKPEDRRELFDEAAGIVKFKRRKAMSLKKLEEERTNLTRVSDILSEITKQLVPLEKQSQAAKTFLRKKDELKTYEINLFLLETERINGLIGELDEQIGNAGEELEETQEKFDETKTEYAQVEEEMDLVDAELSESKDQLNKTNILKQQLENQIEVLREQINTARMKDEHISKRAKALQEEIGTRRVQEQALTKKKEDLIKELAGVRQAHEASLQALKEATGSVEALELSIETRQTDLMQMLNDRAATGAGLERCDAMLEANEAREVQLNAQLLALSDEEAEHTLELETLSQRLETLSADIDEESKHSKSLEDVIASISALQHGLNEQIDALTGAFHRESSRLESLKSLTERYEGYGHAVQKVMERKDEVHGLIGVVADIIQTGKKYELAIETALGGNIQNIVADEEETAKDMIAYLKENKYGRATFLPLNAVRRPKEWTEEGALKEPGVIGLAHTLVKCDRRYEEIIASLLGRILVVDTIDHAIALARKYSYSLRIVTLEGESLQPGGSMTGGAFKRSGNLLSRRRQIEEAEQHIAKLEADLKDAQKAADEKKAEKTAKYKELDTLSETLYRLQLEQNTLHLNTASLSKRMEEIRDAVEDLKSQRYAIESQNLTLNTRKEEIVRSLADSEHLEAGQKELLSNETEKLEALRQAQDQARMESETIRLKEVELSGTENFLTENLNRIAEEIIRFEEELNELDSDKEEAGSIVSEKEANIEKIRRTIEDSAEVFDEIHAAIDAAAAKKEALTQKHRSFIERRESLSEHLAQLDKEIFRLNSRRDSHTEAIEKQRAYMWEEYELTINQAKRLRKEDLTHLPEIKRQINALKNEMKEMGPINLNAIEDYKELAQRHAFLDGQHRDLIEAEQSLLSIIGELDAGMQKQFAVQFARIQEEFNRVFRELFGGGHATLQLVEEDNLLESGIQITAQPPGKKLQNMMQMSGGEKALTAIALLFAIQNMKPSPFCLLDEIEAALDDANVKRFADYLKKMTKHTQFIMITHRRGTMTAADRLYGITMQEKGVSTLVSVDLVSDKLDA